MPTLPLSCLPYLLTCLAYCYAYPAIIMPALPTNMPSLLLRLPYSYHYTVMPTLPLHCCAYPTATLMYLPYRYTVVPTLLLIKSNSKPIPALICSRTRATRP